jgi:class 3 adenylate cyclase
VSRAAGREIDARADEFFAVFERAADAAGAAVAIQRGIRHRRWPDGLDVRVRIGIHGGRPTLTDAGYVGLAVHTVARICAAARGGQILASGETRTAVETAGRVGIDFRRLGRYRLPGLTTSQTLFEVASDGPQANGAHSGVRGRRAPRR